MLPYLHAPELEKVRVLVFGNDRDGSSWHERYSFSVIGIEMAQLLYTLMPFLGNCALMLITHAYDQRKHGGQRRTETTHRPRLEHDRRLI